MKCLFRESFKHWLLQKKNYNFIIGNVSLLNASMNFHTEAYEISGKYFATLFTRFNSEVIMSSYLASLEPNTTFNMNG